MNGKEMWGTVLITIITFMNSDYRDIGHIF